MQRNTIAPDQQRRLAGFTLIEVSIVQVIVALVIDAIGWSKGSNSCGIFLK